MNREHRYNVLTEPFIEDLTRSLESMEIDESIKFVTVNSRKKEIFSFGTDLNYLYLKKKQGQIEKIDKYLQKLYNFQNFVANFHKPLLFVGSGIASN